MFCRYGKNVDKVHCSLGDWDNCPVLDIVRDDQFVNYNFLAFRADNFPQQTYLAPPGFWSENICCQIQVRNVITNIWKLSTPVPKTISMHLKTTVYLVST